MKKFIITSIAMLGMASLCNAATDTVTVIQQPSQVIITETSTGVKVSVQGSKDNEAASYSYSVEHQANDKVTTSQEKDWEIRTPYSKKERCGHWSIELNGFYMGGGISHSWKAINNSFEIGLLNVLGLQYDSKHGQVFSLGIGIHHRSYSIKRPNMLDCDENTHIVGTVLYPEGVKEHGRTSNLNMWALQMPLTYRQKIYKKLAFKVGGIMNWNYMAHVNNHFKMGNKEYDVTQRGLKQKPITFDLLGGLAIGDTGIYCRYSPNDVFKKGYGPEIKDTWTLGVAFGF